MLMAVLVLHVFCFLVFTVYFMNGLWPCSVEFWAMSLYLPIGIGLFQAANQQLLIVSRQQTQLITSNDTFKPLLPSRGHGFGTRRYWLWRCKLWYRSISTQGKYEGFVLIGIILQVNQSNLGRSSKRVLTVVGIVHGINGRLQHLSQIQSLRHCSPSYFTSFVPSWMGVVYYVLRHSFMPALTSSPGPPPSPGNSCGTISSVHICCGRST